MEFFVYILESEKDGSLYTGQTADLVDRLRLHNAGRIRATKGHRPFRLAFFESFPSRRDAMWREWELKKRWNTERKRKLIKAFDPARVKAITGL